MHSGTASRQETEANQKAKDERQESKNELRLLK
jgi:hypothetical protein